MSEVEGTTRIREQVEVVAADAPQHLGVSSLDFCGVDARQSPDRAMTFPFNILLGAYRLQLGGSQRSRVDSAAITQQHPQFQDVIDRLAVDDGVRAGGVV